MPGFTGGVADTTEDPNSVNATWVLSKGCCIYTFLERYCKSNTLVTTHVVSRVLQISVAVKECGLSRVMKEFILYM